MPEQLDLTEKQIENLVSDLDDVPGYVLIDDGEYVDDGKYSICHVVIQRTSDGKYFSATVMRSGSYYSDYNYQFYAGGEVVKKSITIERWVSVK